MNDRQEPWVIDLGDDPWADGKSYPVRDGPLKKWAMWLPTGTARFVIRERETGHQFWYVVDGDELMVEVGMNVPEKRADERPT